MRKVYSPCKGLGGIISAEVIDVIMFPEVPSLTNNNQVRKEPILKTKEDFDRFLEAASKLHDEGEKKPPKKVDPNLLSEVLNWRFTC